jgi:aminoglycoside phosphotransferase (APT) family kinase protein
VDDATLAWIRDALGASKVREQRSISFGIVSDLCLVEADDRPFVLRRYFDDALLESFPHLVSDEAKVLVEARSVLGDLVPELVAIDPCGHRVGRPALLMTYLPGNVQVHGLDPSRLAAPLATLHASEPPKGLPGSRSWLDPERVAPPEWSASAGSWAKLVEIVQQPEPQSTLAFLHRDLHPGNVLWRGGELSGIVDWAFAGRGPRALDVAHTRANLALVDGVEAADRFLEAYVDRAPSYRHDAWWDAAELFVFIDDFSSPLALNTFGADLDIDLLRSRTDAYARSLTRHD